MRDEARVVPLAAGEIERAAALLARAFDTDPLTAYLFPDPLERARRAPLMFTALTRYDHLFGRVDRLGNFGAVATWLGPEHGAETPERLSDAGFDDLPAQVGSAPLDRLAAVYAVVEEAHRQAAPDAHWYLRLLGVEPTEQGNGLGGALLRHGVARADAAGDACFLETFEERNVSFYRRSGFELVVEETEPTSGLRFWGFLRG